jgi:hypothetical protein
LGDTGTFVFRPNRLWGLSTKTASLGMKCREPKPNSRRIGLKVLSVCMGREARHPLRPIARDFTVNQHQTRTSNATKSRTTGLEMPIGPSEVFYDSAAK